MRIPLQKIEALLEPIVSGLGCELVACQWVSERGRQTLRVLVDKEGGIQVGDCEAISELVNPALDVEDCIPGSYDLEVSSPGLERPLRKKIDFERFAGQMVQLATQIPIHQRRKFRGLLVGLKEDLISIDVDSERLEIPFSEIEKAELVVDWDQILKKNKESKR